jgi:hypothetical protein
VSPLAAPLATTSTVTSMTSQALQADQDPVRAIAKITDNALTRVRQGPTAQHGLDQIRQTVTTSPQWPEFVRLAHAGRIQNDFVKPKQLADIVLGWAGASS